MTSTGPPEDNPSTRSPISSNDDRAPLLFIGVTSS
jgi:hypothetical protein